MASTFSKINSTVAPAGTVNSAGLYFIASLIVIIVLLTTTPFTSADGISTFQRLAKCSYASTSCGRNCLPKPFRKSVFSADNSATRFAFQVAEAPFKAAPMVAPAGCLIERNKATISFAESSEVIPRNDFSTIYEPKSAGKETTMACL